VVGVVYVGVSVPKLSTPDACVCVCVCFDVCAAAPFDARRLLCQAMRSDVCSFSCRRIKESSKGESGFLIPVYNKDIPQS